MGGSKDVKPATATDYQWSSVPPDNINADRLSQKKASLWWGRLSAYACLLTGGAYFWFRFKLTQTSFTISNLVGLAALLAELTTGFARLACYLGWVSTSSDDAPSLALVGDKAPTVDIFLTYCGEGIDVISDTMYAACDLDYPMSSFRVIILDDACDEELRKLVVSLNSRYPNLHYSTRGRRPKIHSKAANMNHGLEFTLTLPGGPSEYCAGLDADNVPERVWLRRVMPHLVKDQEVGAVCAPARAYNIPEQDVLQTALEPRLMYGVILPLSDGCGQTVIIGTGFVVRRTALDAVGGFPTESVTDDGLLTIKLRVRGWKIVWVQEYVQWNLVTDTLEGQIKQRQRWVIGAVNNMVFVATTKDAFWTLKTRVHLVFNHILGFLPSISAPLLITAFALAVASNSPMLEFERPEDLRFLLTLALVDVTAQIWHGITVSYFSSTPIPTLYYSAKQWVAPYLLSGLLKHYFPAAKPKASPDFQPASVFRADVATPTPKKAPSSPVIARLTSILAQPGGFVNLACFALVVFGTIAAASSALSSSSAQGLGIADALEDFATKAGWPPLLLMSLTVAVNAWVLVSYALEPPPAVLRESLLKRERDGELVYPSEKAVRIYEKEAAESEWWLGGFVGYCACVGVILAFGS